ncbi:hypothetical protein BDK51DRAFT_26929 [Blyttiomyces helicus]|uniref:Uncharacterized protein n=1 Tax=Blyttiomyces helicus TaxID=388810 RepID=A0A4P9WMX3_9FUNG|nr:hypothetical protein BDK51DRAFT_26929 [Blyttiomyces helicus]|eukprot:RKO92550.1 hypothetical protein BDK51DRAFT_26929 [Blyttiomyces helicus]
MFREGMIFVEFLKGEIKMFDIDWNNPRAKPVCLEANPRFTDWIIVADFDDLSNPGDTGWVSNISELEIVAGSEAHDKLTNKDLFSECSLGELDAMGAEIDIDVKALLGSLRCRSFICRSWMGETGSCSGIGRRIGFVSKESMYKVRGRVGVSGNDKERNVDILFDGEEDIVDPQVRNLGGHDPLELQSSEDRQKLIGEKALDDLLIGMIGFETEFAVETGDIGRKLITEREKIVGTDQTVRELLVSRFLLLIALKKQKNIWSTFFQVESRENGGMKMRSEVRKAKKVCVGETYSFKKIQMNEKGKNGNDELFFGPSLKFEKRVTEDREGEIGIMRILKEINESKDAFGSVINRSGDMKAKA